MKTSIKQLLLITSLSFGLATIVSAEEVIKKDVSDRELQKFVEVQEDLNEIRQEFSQRVQQAENAEEAAQIQQETTDKMMEAVRNYNMKVSDYNAVAAAIQQNPALMEKAQAMQAN